MIPYQVVNLGQAGQDMIATRDFNAFFNYALAQAGTLATIARGHELSVDEEEQVRRAVGNIQQYTLPMTSCPAPAPAAAPAPIASGIPWWAAAAAGLGIGAAAVGLLA